MNKVEQEIRDKLLGAVSEILEIDRDRITGKARFIEDLGAGSLEVMDLIVEMEDVFDVLISDADASRLRTVDNALDYLKTRLLETA